MSIKIGGMDEEDESPAEPAATAEAAPNEPDFGPIDETPTSDADKQQENGTQPQNKIGGGLFEREMNRGDEALSEERFDHAVHHFSVAAALRPDSAEIKEKLRSARQLRNASMEQH